MKRLAAVVGCLLWLVPARLDAEFLQVRQRIFGMD
jgi:hypothetical protein